MHWDESSGLPPIVQVSSKVFPGRPTNALIICANTTIVKGCGLVPNLELSYKSPCHYSIIHSSAPSSQNSHVAPARDRLPALPPQVWLTGLEQDGPPTSTPS